MTLQTLTPDDPAVPLLMATAAQGLGRVEEAVGWAEKASAAGSPDGTSPLSRAARATALAFIAWAREDAIKNGKKEDADKLLARGKRLVAAGGGKPVQPDDNSMLVLVTWSHPELHPSLWTNALGTPMPSPDNFPALRRSRRRCSRRHRRPPVKAELRLEPEDAARAARLGATAPIITVIVAEGTPGTEHIDPAHPEVAASATVAAPTGRPSRSPPTGSASPSRRRPSLRRPRQGRQMPDPEEGSAGAMNPLLKKAIRPETALGIHTVAAAIAAGAGMSRQVGHAPVDIGAMQTTVGDLRTLHADVLIRGKAAGRRPGAAGTARHRRRRSREDRRRRPRPHAPRRRHRRHRRRDRRPHAQGPEDHAREGSPLRSSGRRVAHRGRPQGFSRRDGDRLVSSSGGGVRRRVDARASRIRCIVHAVRSSSPRAASLTEHVASGETESLREHGGPKVAPGDGVRRLDGRARGSLVRRKSPGERDRRAVGRRHELRPGHAARRPRARSQNQIDVDDPGRGRAVTHTPAHDLLQAAPIEPCAAEIPDRYARGRDRHSVESGAARDEDATTPRPRRRCRWARPRRTPRPAAWNGPVEAGCAACCRTSRRARRSISSSTTARRVAPRAGRARDVPLPDGQRQPATDDRRALRAGEHDSFGGHAGSRRARARRSNGARGRAA